MLDTPEPDQIVASHTESLGTAGTEWRIVAVAGGALVTVHASSPEAVWILDRTWDNRGVHLADDDKLDARLRRLADVESVEVAKTKIHNLSTAWLFDVEWRLHLRGGTAVDIQASERTPAARQACDALVAHVRSAVTA